MKKQLHILLLFLTFSITAFSQVANQPSDLEVCDNDNDGFSQFDLTIVEAQVLDSQDPVDYILSFYETQGDADAGSNSINSPLNYNNIANSQTIYVRLEDMATGNYDSTNFNLIVNPIPNIVAVSPYQLCDFVNPGDEQEQFDLTTKSTEILNGQINVSVAYYQTLEDAQTDTNAIIGLYTNLANPQTIYATLTNTISGCNSQVTFNLIVHPVPIVNTPTPIELCDDGTPDGLTSIDLSFKNTEITGGNPTYAISYYLNQADADNGVSPIANPTQYTNISNPQTIIARVVDTNTGCFATTSLELIVEQAPVAYTPAPLRYCDVDNDGFGLFTLTDVENEITGGAVGLTVSYHETYANAFNNVNTIYTTVDYNNIIAYSQTLYARVESATLATNCVTFVEIDLIVEPSPQLVAPTPLEECDDISADGFATFDLTIKSDEVLVGQDPTQYILSYYESEANAEDAMSPIANPLAYTNTVAINQIIWIRVEDNTTVEGCYKLTTLELIVNALPVLVTPIPLELCDDDNDGFVLFLLEDANAEILNGQTGIALTNYETQTDADNATNPIVSPYTNTTNPQTIYVRAENYVTGCYNTTTLTLRVLPNPSGAMGNPEDLALCDENNNGTAAFDLTVNEPLINPSGEPFDITYFLSEADATGNTSNITSPNNYTNISNPQTIYVRVETYDGCYSTTFFTIEVRNCTDTDNDGVIDSDEDLNNNGNLEDDDTDSDDIPNYLDDDDDGDGVDTIIEINIALGRNAMHSFVDTDNDLIENYLDDDDDGDNVLTIDEDYNNNGDPTDDDTNNNSIPDYLESSVALSVNGFNVSNFKLFPNPAKGEVTIQLANSNFETGKLNVFNIQGKMILKDIKFQVQTSTLDISSLESGLYFVKLNVGNTSTIQKLMVN